MVSDFLTPSGRLSCQGDGGRGEYASTLVETGSRKEWWTNEMMMGQLRKAVGIFKKEFPGCTGVWLFDNSANHGAFSTDALSAKKIGMNPGGKQPKMRDGFKNGNSGCCKIPTSHVWSIVFHVKIYLEPLSQSRIFQRPIPRPFPARLP